MSNPVQGYPPPPPNPAKKPISPVIWILIGIAGFMILAGVAVVGTGIYLAKRVMDNPIEAAASMIAAANPDVEVVSKNADKGLITFREKSTGKTVTVDLEQIKQGKLSFTSDDKEVHVEAGEGGIRLKSSDGETAVIGGGPVHLPSWMPAYPGADMRGTMSASKDEKQSAMVGFTTKDSFRKVLDFYTDALKKNGFTVEARTVVSDTTAVLTAKSDSPERSAMVNVTTADGETNVGLIFTEKQ
jgi:hypothetical protein